MAEAVLFNLADGILKTLGSQFLQEVGLLWGFKDELNKLKGTVSTIQAVLLDAEERSVGSHQIREWLGQLKDAMIDADYLLDDFSTEALRRRVISGNNFTKEVRIFFSRSNQLVYGFKIAHKIKDMRARLDGIAASRKFHLVERPLERPVMPQDREQTHSRVPQLVVGRDVDKEAIVELLLSDSCEENVGTLPIVGMGGLGKTTLAQLVFNDERVKNQFELRLWVSVADNFDVMLIVKKIIMSSTRRESHVDLEMNSLVDNLHHEINGKKYLLVLDDVWNEDHAKWSRLKDLLVGGGKGSMIIVTTRLLMVAKLVNPEKMHELKGLSKEESWLLFSQLTFPRRQMSSEGHKEIGEEIISKCSGVPLAIKVIGSFLRIDTSIVAWSSFRNKDLMTIGKGESNILSILKLSYDHLPSYLKHCFAICSLFFQHDTISVPKLINLWMAQGYLGQSSSSQCLEEVGLKYFMDLYWRSFFQEVEEDDWGNIITCKMHDLMYDLAKQVAGQDTMVSDPNWELVNKKTRHASFYFMPFSSWVVPSSLLEANSIQTSLLMNESDSDLYPRGDIQGKHLDVIFRNLRRLRFLDLHYFGIIKVPHSVRKLKHLRYLDLSFNEKIEVLPDSITELYNLQVLLLKNCMHLIQLPKDIHQLIHLSELDLTGCGGLTHMPQRLGQLTCLQKLGIFVAPRDGLVSKEAGGLDELGGLNNLKGKLKLKYLKNANSDARAANLKEKEHLRVLSLSWDREDEEEGSKDMDEMALDALEPHRNLKVLKVFSNVGLRFPEWLSSLTNLKKIHLQDCWNCQYLPPLHQLPRLEELEIWNLHALEYVDSGGSSDSIEGSSFFPSLKQLGIHFCQSLKGWWRTSPAAAPHLLPRFPLLSNLSIVGCPNLISMPLFPPPQVLAFGDSNLKSFQDFIKTMGQAEQTSSSPWPLSLSQLENLSIAKIEDLEILPENLVQHLGSLKVLRVGWCERLKTLGPAVRNLTSLEMITLTDCESLDLSEDEGDDQGKPWPALLILFLEGLPKLLSLPKWIQHLPTLKVLEIKECHNLMSLPDWMVRLTSLQALVIENSQQLSGRCRSKNGEDWPYIAHIPNIKVDGTWVQRYGRCLFDTWEHDIRFL